MWVLEHQQKKSVPFFYEPAFKAYISPLPALLRKQNEERKKNDEVGVVVMKDSLRYGDFLLEKVGGNFQTIKDCSLSN